MFEKFKEHIKINFPFLKNEFFLVAVSGGVDSMVLVDLLQKSGLRFSIAHCNFKLRSEESDSDELFVKKFSLTNGIPLHTKSFNTNLRKYSTQMAARELRYDWFKNVLKNEKMNYVLTGHHLDDSLETFFLNMTRSTGIDGMLGISNQNKFKIRPLLIYSKQEILDYANKNKLVWREDTSNKSNKYLRNKIRNEIIPVFKEINPEFLNIFKKTTDFLTNSRNLIHHHIQQLKSKGFKKNQNKETLIDKDFINKNKESLYYLFRDFGFSNKDQILNLSKSSTGKILESKSHTLLSNRKHLILKKKDFRQQMFYKIHKDGSDVPFNIIFKNGVFNSKSSKKSFYLNEIDINFPLLLRKFKKGDVFFPDGMKGKKTLSKFFKDEKMSLFDKENQWLLCNNDEIMWIVGKRADRRYHRSNNANLKIEIS